MAIAALLGRAGARLIAGEYQDSGQHVKRDPASRPAMSPEFWKDGAAPGWSTPVGSACRLSRRVSNTPVCM
jgi:hypothetical protein